MNLRTHYPHALVCIALLISFGIFNNAIAEELLGVRLGAIIWNSNIQGRLQSEDIATDTGTTSATRLSPFQLGITDEQQKSYFFELSHNLPVIPRFIYRQTNIETSTDSALNQDISFVNSTIASGTAVTSLIDLSFKDYSLYYSLLDSWITLDIGVTQRQFDGQVSILNQATGSTDGGTDGGDTDGGDTGGTGGGDTGGGGDTTGGDGGTTTTATLPIAIIDENPLMLFSNVQFQLPRIPMQLAFKSHYLNSGNDHISDQEATLSYYLDTGLLYYRIDLGYKKVKVMSPDLGVLESRLKIQGPFFGVTLSI